MSIPLIVNVPSRDAPDTFDEYADGVFPQMNAVIAAMNSLGLTMDAISLGGVFAFQYVFSTTTTDADPGAGFLRFNSGTQNGSTVVRLDSSTALLQDVSALLDTFDDSTSAIKGFLKIEKRGDPTKWAQFNVTAIATPSGYRNFTVAAVLFSTANPFANGDPLNVYFQRNGDKGDPGTPGVSGWSNLVILTSSQSWVVPATVVKGEVSLVDGGYGGGGVSGSPSGATPGGRGGNGGVSVIALTPGTSCTATIGAAGAGGSTGLTTAGGATSFAGTGFTTLTSANATLKVPGGQTGFFADNVDAGTGGGSMFSPNAGTGYGAGGKGGYGGAGQAGQPGVIVIRY